MVERCYDICVTVIVKLFLRVLAEVLFLIPWKKPMYLFSFTGPCRGGLYTGMPSEMMV